MHAVTIGALVRLPRAASLLPLLIALLLAVAMVPLPSVTPRDSAVDAQADDQVVREDAAIEAQLRRALAPMGGLRLDSVEVSGGVATISGEASDSGVVTQARRLAEAIPGVTSVEADVRLSSDVGERIGGAAERLSTRFDAWIAYLPLLPIALGVLLVAIFLAWLVGRLRSPYARMTPNVFLQEIARRVTQSIVLIIGALLALEILDAVALVGGLLGAAGIVGLTLGFAFRDIVENYVASILLSLRQPFAPRDHVVVAGQEGLVTRLTTRATILTTFDGNMISVPNAMVFKSVILNYTRRPERRFTFAAGVGYDVDLQQARDVAVQVLRETDGVLAEPEPFALITDLGASSVRLEVYGWVDQRTHMYLRVRSLAMQRVKAEFDRLDIDMPEPIYNIRTLPGGGAISVEGARPELAHAAHPPEPRRPDEVSEDIRQDDTMQRLVRANQAGTEGSDLLSGKGERE